MGIISKITPQPDPNQLAGKPVRITKFKDGEVLIYNTTRKQWEAGTVASAPMRGVAVFVSATEPTEQQLNDIWIKI